MATVSMDALADFAVRLLTAKGMTAADARYVAEKAVTTEAFGISTHGLKVLPYLAGALGKTLDPAAQPTVVREKPASALIEAEGAVGQLALRKAIDLATAKARACGVAMVAVRNGSWLGALGVYLLDVAEAGLLAQLWAQSTTCKDCAPVGGIDARFSTNPVALAFPTGDDPMIADFSTAAYSLGKAFQMIRAGRRAPEPLFLDRDGNYTDDPGVLEKEGSILFAGGRHLGHKGYALSLWCEALTAVGGGDCNNPAVAQRQNFNLTVIDPEAFAGADAYLAEMRRFVVHVKSSRLRPGWQAIRLPGERGYAALHTARARGVPVADDLLATLTELGAKHGIPAPQ